MLQRWILSLKQDKTKTLNPEEEEEEEEIPREIVVVMWTVLN